MNYRKEREEIKTTLRLLFIRLSLENRCAFEMVILMRNGSVAEILNA